MLSEELIREKEQLQSGMEALKADRARQVGIAIAAALPHAGRGAEEDGHVTGQCPQTVLIVLTGKELREFLA